MSSAEWERLKAGKSRRLPTDVNDHYRKGKEH